MAASRFSTFHNNDATAFLADFEEAPSEVLLLEALVAAAEEDGHLEADAAAQALAAAEIVAAWLEDPAPDFPAALLPLTEDFDVSDPDELVDLARQAVQAVLRDSELRDYWQQHGEAAQWQAAQLNLLERLG